jgi:subtilisin family serine protease
MTRISVAANRALLSAPPSRSSDLRARLRALSGCVDADDPGQVQAAGDRGHPNRGSRRRFARADREPVSIVRPAHGKSAAARIAAYDKRADVLYAEPNAQMRALALSPPNDPFFPSQWAFDVTGALAGWALYPGAYGATGGAPLAIVDTGVQATHEDLSGRVSTGLGASCVNSVPCVAGPAADDLGHGTHVAGMLARPPTTASASRASLSRHRSSL